GGPANGGGANGGGANGGGAKGSGGYGRGAKDEGGKRGGGGSGGRAHRGGLAVAAGVAALALAGGVPALAAARPAAPRGDVLVNCAGRAQVRPGGYVLTCADGNDYLAGLHWVSWSGGAAFGRGTEHVNDCIPNCAEGHFHAYPVLVT